MHPTDLARSVCWLLTILTLGALSVLAGGELRDSDTLFLDLTKPVPPGEQVTRMPGASIGGVGGVAQSDRFALPLTVQLESISPEPIEPGAKATIQVILRNTGSATFYLPASRNAATALAHGNRGRRTFLFLLVVEDPMSGEQTTQVMASSAASNAVPASWIRLGPGQRVRVRFLGGFDQFAELFRPQFRGVRVRAQVTEWKYEDTRYVIESRADPVTSGNALMLELGPAK